MEFDLKIILTDEYKKVFPRLTNKGWLATLGLCEETVIDCYELCKKRIAPYEFILVLNYLKEYRTAAAFAASWNMDEGTLLDKFWRCLKEVDTLLPELCFNERLNERFPKDHFFHLVLTCIDGVLFTKERPSENNVRNS